MVVEDDLFLSKQIKPLTEVVIGLCTNRFKLDVKVNTEVVLYSVGVYGDELTLDRNLVLKRGS